MQKEGIPFDPNGAVIYHCGPVVKDNQVLAAGPTTSARMNELSGFLFDKGWNAVREQIFENRATATQEHIFEATLEADDKKESVDDIIAQFKKAKG